MKEIYEDPKTGRYKWREKQSESEPPVRVQRLVSRRRKNQIVMVLAALMLGIIGALQGWKMVLITVGLAVLLLCFWGFLGWYHQDD
jgi:hypothetical protein